ncbi:hypothetical protein [Roseateles oligotrophus]|nr:hypothetical protein [Roseateles oligotrophus]
MLNSICPKALASVEGAASANFAKNQEVAASGLAFSLNADAVFLF